jgi:MFS family permease
MFRTSLKVVLAAVAFATFIYSWDFNMMPPVLPFYVGQNAGALGIDPKGVGAFLGWVMAGYALVNCGGNLVFGWASDIRGRRIMLTIGFLGCAIALAFYERMTTAGGLLAIRCIHGFFSGALGPCTAAILADTAPQERQGWRMAMWAIFASVGTLIASPLAGWLKSAFGAGTVWTVMAVAYALTTVVVWLLIPDTRKLFAGETTPAAQSAPDARVRRWGFLGRIIQLILCLLPGLRRWGFLGRINIWIACVGIMALFWVMGAWVTVFTQHLTALGKAKVIGVDPSMAFGMLMGLYGFSVIAMGGQLGRLCDLIGRKPLLITAFGLLTLAPFLVATSSLPIIVIGWGLCYGLGGVMIWSSVMAVMTDELQPHERGTGMGLFMVFPTLGIGIGSPVIGILSDVLGLGTAMTVGCVLPAVAFIMSFFARRRVECKPVSGRLKTALGIGAAVYIVIVFAMIPMLGPK